MHLLLAAASAFLIAGWAVEAQPAQGIPFVDAHFTIITPDSFSQCNNATIFYNITDDAYYAQFGAIIPMIIIRAVDGSSDPLVSINLPKSGAGYVDWTCIVPAGYPIEFFAIGETEQVAFFTVQLGQYSSCLGSGFGLQSAEYDVYTSSGIPPDATISALSATWSVGAFVTSRVPFPTDDLPTITAAAGTAPLHVPDQTGRILGATIGGIMGVGILIAAAILYVRLVRRSIAKDYFGFAPKSGIDLDGGETGVARGGAGGGGAGTPVPDFLFRLAPMSPPTRRRESYVPQAAIDEPIREKRRSVESLSSSHPRVPPALTSSATQMSLSPDASAAIDLALQQMGINQTDHSTSQLSQSTAASDAARAPRRTTRPQNKPDEIQEEKL